MRMDARVYTNLRKELSETMSMHEILSGPGSVPLGKVIRERLRSTGLSQEWLGKQIERSQPWVSCVLKGEIMPSDDDIEAIAAVFTTSAEELWNEAGGKRSADELQHAVVRDVLAGFLVIPVISLEKTRTLEGPVVIGKTHVAPEQAFQHASILAVSVDGTADGLLPEGIEAGDLLYVDPDLTPAVGRIVIARFSGGLVVGRVEKLTQRDTLAVLAREGGEDASLTVAVEQIEGVVFSFNRDV